jgi:nicotinate-nucleotide--dimethylbenzimidazole phosphoribosyltransferase
MSEIEKALQSIPPLSASLRDEAQKRLDNLTKPRGSLGRLEEFARRYVSMRGDLKARITKKRVIVFAADHGVVAEGVSAYPKDVTYQMVLNFLNGGAGINVISRHVHAEVAVVDIGVDHEFEAIPGLVMRKVARGTDNMAQGPAMTRDTALEAMEVGCRMAFEAIDDGVDILATGEMGIGNTTASSAITAVFTRRPVREVTGLGTGIDEKTFAEKVAVIEKAIAVNKPDRNDAMDVLCKIGGLEIAGIAGMVIGAASRRIPVVLDGFISSVGGLVAYELNNEIGNYLFAAHRSVEIGHLAVLERMGLIPFVDLNLRLGEGTGAAIGMDLIDLGLKVMDEMATFEDAGVSDRE